MLITLVLIPLNNRLTFRGDAGVVIMWVWSGLPETVTAVGATLVVLWMIETKRPYAWVGALAALYLYDGIIDAVNFLYAGQSRYEEELWPHNSFLELRFGNMRTNFYLLTGLGSTASDLTIGTFCHENGHLLCRFPDMYDYGNRDGDGVIDPEDRCPNTPAGSRVDQFGCLVLFEERGPATPGAPARPTLILQGVNFQSGRSVLTAASYAILDQVAASLVANPEIRIEIAGYTDSTGSRRMNLGLSQARAIAVRAYLARKGVAPLRMRATGYGASGYIADNKTPEGRAMNRRVELHKLN